ncbi:AAA domain-containing protein [Patescibacteria group bacterium]
MLESVLGKDLYYSLVEELSLYEIDGKLTLPITKIDIFTEIWHKLKAQLRLKKDVNFDENSFSLKEMRISLSPRANYFLAEDLQKLSKLDEKDLKGTALTSWVEDEDLNLESEVPREGELYFPFLYDKYQLSVLSLIKNKAAIIQGPPGTGKSETISNLLCHLAANGKRVLFVSQKAQALKIVKDKLKNLNIKYFFGYIPNPASSQIGEEDEIDGIAPQLTGLNSYIQKLGYKFHSRRKFIEYTEKDIEDPSILLKETAKEKSKLKNDFQKIIDLQRIFYDLNEELKRLKDYDITISNIPCFEKSFSSSKWQNIKDLQRKIDKTIKEIEQYETKKDKKELDKVFKKIEFTDSQYSKIILELKENLLTDLGKIELLQQNLSFNFFYFRNLNI